MVTMTGVVWLEIEYIPETTLVAFQAWQHETGIFPVLASWLRGAAVVVRDGDLVYRVYRRCTGAFRPADAAAVREWLEQHAVPGRMQGQEALELMPAPDVEEVRV